MADKDGDGPPLELPSLGFGRKRRRPATGADEPAPAAAPATPPAEREAPPVTEHGPASAEDEVDRPDRSFSLPAVSGMTAALITGAVVGALMVGLTGAGFRLCEVVQGTPSCGDPGLLLLLAIVIVVVVVGKAMLAAWSVADPGSTSFLAVGLLCVLALLLLVDVLFDRWMILVIPLLSMLCFALSHWVTTAFVEPDE